MKIIDITYSRPLSRGALIAAIAAAALSASSLDAQAQTVEQLASQVKIENKQHSTANGNMLLNFDLNLDSLDMPSNRRLVFTPVVSNGEQEVTMPKVVVNGRRQQIMYDRGVDADYGDNATVVKRNGDKQQTVNYRQTIGYEPWMGRSYDVNLLVDECGCGDKTSTVLPVGKKRKPYIYYIYPEAEPKVQELHKTAYIDFPVDKITLYPNYRRNPRELMSIVRNIDSVRADQNISIQSINIHGFASPESPYSHNDYLAKNRAKTLKDYVRSLMSMDDNLFTVSSTPENWEGLRKYVAESDINHKQEILALIDDNSLDPDVKEKQIKTSYPTEYKYMLQEWYPALRRSDYTVKFKIREFTVYEAKEILKTKPSQLSLNELFQVAQTYEMGSSDFNNVMDIATRLYPESDTARVNAAYAYLDSGDLKAAQACLDKCGDTPDAIHARGILAMLSGDNDDAVRLITRAKELGVKGADENLKNLK